MNQVVQHDARPVKRIVINDLVCNTKLSAQMSSSSSPSVASWARILEGNADTTADLEAVTRYALGSYEQHLEAVATPGIVPAIVQCLSDRTHDTTQQVLLALKALSISKKGQQVLITAGAHDAICNVLPHLLASTGSSDGSHSLDECEEQPAKRARLADVVPLDVLEDAMQLLADLLLRSPAGPPIGSLEHSVNAFTALQQAMSSTQWCSWSPASQRNAAGVLARLAMEPAVEALLLCTSCDSMQPSVTSEASASSCTSCTSSSSSGNAFTALLSSPEGSAGFFRSVWEAASVHYVSSAANRCSPTGSRFGCNECGDRQQQQQLQQHQLQPRIAVKAEDMGRSPLWQVAQELTAAGLFDHILPHAWHCPVMGVNEMDALLHLQELHRAGQLLKPLQHELDFRLIRAVPATTAAAAALSHGLSAHTSQHRPHRQHSQHATTEQLLAFESHVTAESIAAACEMQPHNKGSGFSLVLRDVPKRVAAVAELVNSIEQQLGLPAGANLYYTPPGAQGLKLHYDDHCVFVLQLQGCKAWQVAPAQQQHMQLPMAYQPRIPVDLPTVVENEQQQQQQQRVHGQQNLAETWPTDQQQQQQTQQHMLLPGDVLYIPRGWVHQAWTPGKQVAVVPAALDATASASGATVDTVTALPVHDGRSAPSAIASEHSSAAGVATSSLHLSIGVEVEPEFSVQGYLHCLLEHVHFMSSSKCRHCSSDSHSVEPAGNCNSVLSTASQQADAAVSSEGVQVAGLFKAQQGLWGSSSCSIAAESTVVQHLALRAGVMLLHILLWQHAGQHAEVRRACPLLFNNCEIKAAATAALLQQLDCGGARTAVGLSAAAQWPPHHGSSMKQLTSEQAQASKLQVVSSAEHCWIDLALKQAFYTFHTNSSLDIPAHASMAMAAPSGQSDHTLAAQHLLQSRGGQDSTGQQEPALQGTSSTAASRAAAGAHADEQAARQLLLQLDAELLSALQQRLEAEHRQSFAGAEPGSAAAAAAIAPTSAVKVLSGPDTSRCQLPGTPGVLGWIEAVQRPAATAAAVALGSVARGASRHVQGLCHADAVSAATETMSISSFPAGSCATDLSASFSECDICRDVCNSCSCMLPVLQVLVVAAEAHAVNGCDETQSAQRRAANQACNSSSRASCPDPEAHFCAAVLFQSNASAVGGDKRSDCSAAELGAAVHLPHALQVLLQALHCQECREHAATGLIQTARTTLGARKAVRHAHLALHTVKHGMSHAPHPAA